MEPLHERDSTKLGETRSKIKYSIDMNAEMILRLCKTEGTQDEISNSLIDDRAPPPSRHEPPTKKLNHDELHPPTPAVYLTEKKEALSPELPKFCIRHSIVVAKGFASALNLNLELFSTKTLVETNPDQIVEVRTQILQSSDINRDQQTGEKVWKCFSEKSHSTIAKYAAYQASTFLEKLTEEENVASSRMSDSDTKHTVRYPKRRRIGSSKHSNQPKMLKFGTNVDLSNTKKWGAQLHELTKLPAFAKVTSAANMLSHVRDVVFGVNTVQLDMKVPGSRNPGHQEKNSFCSINVNVGPDDCEWFAVPGPYWGAVFDLCEKHRVNFLHGSWWPVLDDLYKANIPVHRFLQRPGDMVWVNAGCIHWVQSKGWCNNIAWNVGPLTACQYKLAIERYEWNKFKFYKSIVPMVNLSWNLARNILVRDPKLFSLIKYSLMRTFRQCLLTLAFVKNKGVEVKFHGRDRKEMSHYCRLCEIEVFNVLLIKKQENPRLVYCLDCACKQSPNLKRFVCLEEYKLEELKEIYDNFKFYSTIKLSAWRH